MRDGVTLARLGTPVVVLVTDEFVQEAAFVARAVGMPDIPIVRLPHPTAGVGRERLGMIAESIVAPVLSALRNVPAEGER